MPAGQPRKYPTGLGFGTVVCANYWYETLGVLAMVIMTGFDIGSTCGLLLMYPIPSSTDDTISDHLLRGCGVLHAALGRTEVRSIQAGTGSQGLPWKALQDVPSYLLDGEMVHIIYCMSPQLHCPVAPLDLYYRVASMMQTTCLAHLRASTARHEKSTESCCTTSSLYATRCLAIMDSIRRLRDPGADSHDPSSSGNDRHAASSPGAGSSKAYDPEDHSPANPWYRTPLKNKLKAGHPYEFVNITLVNLDI